MGVLLDMLLLLALAAVVFTGLAAVAVDNSSKYNVSGVTDISANNATAYVINTTTGMQEKIEKANTQNLDVFGIAGVMLGFAFDGLRVLFGLPAAFLAFISIIIGTISSILGIPAYLTAVIGVCIIAVVVMKMYEIVTGRGGMI